VGSNNGSFTVSLASNTSSSSRSGTVTVSGGGITRTISVSQSGTSGCTPTSITPYTQVNGGSWQQTASASLSAGGTVKFGPHPSSGGSWRWSGPNSFSATSREITLSNVQSSQAGNYVATYTNSAGCTSTQTFSISLSGTTSSLTVSPTSLSVGAGSSNSTITVTSNVNWSVTDNQSWITTSSTSGSNNGSFTVSLASNTSSSSRSGTVTVSGGGITRTISVSQSGTTSSSTRYEAESATLSGVSAVSNSGASNGQYVNMQGSGSITWTVNVSSSGNYTTTFGYYLPYSAKTQFLNVNGSYVSDVSFDGSVGAWQTKAVTVYLNAGQNTINITASWGYMWFDYLQIGSGASLKIANAQTIRSSSETFKVFPNPSVDMINIMGIQESATFSITNGVGKVVVQGKGNQANVSALPSGIYILKTEDNKVFRFLKK
jgi:hypothetical protein